VGGEDDHVRPAQSRSMRSCAAPRRRPLHARAKLALAALIALAAVTAAPAGARAATAVPELHSPASEEDASSPLAISYTLPEAARAGSATVTFTNEDTHAPIVLVLASAGEAQGAHDFELSTTDPLSSSAVAGETPTDTPIADGEYTVTLAYQNAAGDPAASASVEHVLIRTGTLCKPGHYSELGEEPCNEAPLGAYAGEEGMRHALPCPPGQYASARASTSCTLAAPGYFVAFSGAASEQACAPGTFEPDSAAIVCLPTPAGYYSGEGAAQASECLPGTYAPAAGSASCTLAEPGHYVPESGAKEQLACPPGSEAPAPGAPACTAVKTTTSTTSTSSATTSTSTTTSSAPTSTSTTTSSSAPTSGTAQADRSASAQGAKALLALTCAGQGACRGSLELVASVAQTRAAKGHGKRHRRSEVRNIRIGTASFSIPTGKSETLRVQLSAKGASLLRKAGKRGLEATVKGSDIKTGTLVLKKARKAHKHGVKAP